MSQTNAFITPSIMTPTTKFASMLLPMAYSIQHSRELVITGVSFNAPALKGPYIYLSNAKIELRFSRGALSVAQALASRGSIIEPDKAVLDISVATATKVQNFTAILSQLRPVEMGEINIRDPVVQANELLEQLASRIDILAKPYIDTYMIYSKKQDILTRLVFVDELVGKAKIMLLGSSPLIIADDFVIDSKAIVPLEIMRNMIYALHDGATSQALMGKFLKKLTELRLAYNEFVSKRQDIFISRFAEQLSQLKQEMEGEAQTQETSEDQI